MQTTTKTFVSLILAVLLTACGGGTPETQATQQPQLAASVQLAPQGLQSVSAADYAPLVQELYISYFGRPADSGGLANFQSQLLQLNAPSAISELTSAYGGDANIRALIDSFGTSAESAALYSGDNDAFVTAIFQNVLGRQPAETGKAFWVGALNGNQLSRANASLTIMAAALVNTSAQGVIDASLIRNRVAVASAFTAALNSDARVNAYKGKTAAATVRTMLATVVATTDTAAFASNIESTINTLVANATPPAPAFSTVSGIISQRCVSCHSASFAQAGVRLDNDALIHAQAQNIYTQVVLTRAMPFNNATGMTDAERETIKAWFLAGAN
jgi:mono/diheme cytochrome c family protein